MTREEIQSLAATQHIIQSIIKDTERFWAYAEVSDRPAFDETLKKCATIQRKIVDKLEEEK